MKQSRNGKSKEKGVGYKIIYSGNMNTKTCVAVVLGEELKKKVVDVRKAKKKIYIIWYQYLKVKE